MTFEALTKPELKEWLDRTRNAVPSLLLRFVARHPGCRRDRPLTAVLAAIAANDELVEPQVEAALTWLLRRGDIYLTAGSRLWPSPVAVAVNQEETHAAVTGAIAPHDLTTLLTGTPVSVHADIVHGRGLLADLAIGVATRIELRDVKHDAFINLMEAVGLRTVSEPELRDSLPTIHELAYPQSGRVDLTQLVGGGWSVYDGRDRTWCKVSSPAPTDRLLRWAVENDFGTSRRYFMRADDQRLVELLYGDALLWEYASDWLVHNPGEPAYRGNGEVRLPHPLPPEHLVWLAALGGAPTPEVNAYVVPDSSLNGFRAGIAKTLNLVT